MFECFNCFDIYGILSFDWHLPIKNRSRGRGPKFNFRKPIFCQLLSDHSYLPHYINFTIFVPKPYIKAVRYLSPPIAGFFFKKVDKKVDKKNEKKLEKKVFKN